MLSLRCCILLAAGMGFVPACHGQGLIWFNNRVSGQVDARVTFFDGTGVGAGFTAQLFGGREGTPLELLVPLFPTTTFRTSSELAKGYVYPVEVAVPSAVPYHENITFLMRVFNGASWETSSIRGESNLFTTWTYEGLFPPRSLIGLEPFQVFAIPEPGTAALFVGGALGLLWSCRRQRRTKHSVQVRPVESHEAIAGSRLQMAIIDRCKPT